MKKETKKEKFLNDAKWVYTKRMYHRGKFDNNKVYENTLEAYKLSVKDNAPIELDVQLTNEGEVICLHDTNLKRLFNRDRLVSDISLKRLNKIRDDLKVPTLKEVLQEVDGKVELMIELKNTKHFLNKELVKRVADLLKDYKGDYVIVSFNPNLLRMYKKYDKEAYVGRIGSKDSKNSFNKFFMSDFHLFKLGNPDFISFDVDHFDKEQLLKYKNKGYKITGWALKDKTREKKLNEVFDNYIVEGYSLKGK